MDVWHETPEVTTKPKCYDSTNILVRTHAHTHTTCSLACAAIVRCGACSFAYQRVTYIIFKKSIWKIWSSPRELDLLKGISDWRRQWFQDLSPSLWALVILDGCRGLGSNTTCLALLTTCLTQPLIQHYLSNACSLQKWRNNVANYGEPWHYN